MTPLRIVGAAANVFLIAFLTGYLAKASISGTPLPPLVTLAGSILLYGIAVASLVVTFEQTSGKVARYVVAGSVLSMIVFTIGAVTYAIPEMQQGMVLLSMWGTANVLSHCFGNSTAILSIREQRRRAEQKRKLEMLRTKNPNEPEESSR